jgi:hypothetical protein
MPCPAINDICTKTYEFGPFWGQSKLRKQARDELCAICNSFKLFDPEKDVDYRRLNDMFRQKFGYPMNGQEADELTNLIVEEQEKMQLSFLLSVKNYIENSKGERSNPPSIKLIRQWFDRTYDNIQDVVASAIKFHRPIPNGDYNYEDPQSLF